LRDLYEGEGLTGRRVQVADRSAPQASHSIGNGDVIAVEDVCRAIVLVEPTSSDARDVEIC
jgi:hypothetical protein